MTTDTEFKAQLMAFLGESDDNEVPVMLRDDGTIDREKTLRLQVYAGFGIAE